ncbi:alpha/beta fold hydrolase [Nocardioides donggukensis]|uniref:Alpha/beta hydrolase n=1 Tax=Nocardioides donggukensis TaxID=2774019 RepID=A0A927K1H2_9ACTN|nr:alpha/beta hydrolase [Nocardioides donggukensis]MBD8868542.1 alpha/beta hydrolase [Nocardioides donggukensis]
MTGRRRIWGLAAGAVGVALTGTAIGIARQRHVIARRDRGEARFGSLRSAPVTVVADDGVPLHVEVDELPAEAARGRRRRTVEPFTVVFVHGYALSLDCWHFQRAGYRGLVRAVYYDQRSHGRSGRAPDGHATIDHLGQDLRRVLDEVVPEGRVVLVGHSMGGMSVISLAEQHPELFGHRITGVALISTTAGGLAPHRMVLPMLPEGLSGLGGDLAHRLVAALAHGGRAVDGLRRLGKDIAMVATDMFAFGDDVPPSYVEFVDRMLSGTPYEVLAEFFPNFAALDKFATLNALERVPTVIVCGTSDRMTPVEHSRKLHRLVAGSTLVECPGAGHMVILERHEQVNAALDQLLAAAAAYVPSEPE